ncbi:hypothetical protein [Treponema brennaborense]|uniref:hypothetical protein n=1 Tax=Treponema brennaborense TaxID=81028 RepID=UPI0002EFF2E9|nr:hypothetical protein [Treponema brennaborense]
MRSTADRAFSRQLRVQQTTARSADNCAFSGQLRVQQTTARLADNCAFVGFIFKLTDFKSKSVSVGSG